MGSVSSAIASGDAGERTQVWTVEHKEEFTAAPPRTSDRRKEQTHSLLTTMGDKNLAIVTVKGIRPLEQDSRDEA